MSWRENKEASEYKEEEYLAGEDQGVKTGILLNRAWAIAAEISVCSVWPTVASLYKCSQC